MAVEGFIGERVNIAILIMQELQPKLKLQVNSRDFELVADFIARIVKNLDLFPSDWTAVDIKNEVVEYMLNELSTSSPEDLKSMKVETSIEIIIEENAQAGELNSETTGDQND